MDAAQLRQAYEVLLAEAETGGFGPPPPGEWTAEQVVAPVAANDELLIETTEAVIAGSPCVCYNHNSLHRPQLDALIAECGGVAGLTARVRSSSRLCELVGRLGAGSHPYRHRCFDLMRLPAPDEDAIVGTHVDMLTDTRVGTVERTTLPAGRSLRSDSRPRACWAPASDDERLVAQPAQHRRW